MVQTVFATSDLEIGVLVLTAAIKNASLLACRKVVSILEINKYWCSIAIRIVV